MIEITHTQARRWLREALDARAEDRRRLPEEQWTALQAHLEGCAECRAYRRELDGLEKSLRRAARNALDGLPGPGADVAERVQHARQRREALRRRVLARALTALVLLVVASLASRPFTGLLPVTALGDPLETGPLAAGPPDLPGGDVIGEPMNAQPTLLPTAEPGEFPAVVAYEARRAGRADGDSEIYLLNPGSAPVSLTEHSANDTHPAWSPDGEWLAFLSDRATPDQPEGKLEVYVLSMVNNDPIRLTAEPEIEWQGPLSWSPDGQWIALTGIRPNQGSQSWIYLVPVGEQPDGRSRPRALAGSRGGWGPEFAPSGERVAYSFKTEANSGDRVGVAVEHISTGQRMLANWSSNPQAAQPHPGGQFDWSFDGSGLAYIAAGGNADDTEELVSSEGAAQEGEGSGSQIMAVRDLSYSNPLSYQFSRNTDVARSRWTGAYPAVTWTPSGAVVYLEDLGDARAHDQPGEVPDGCFTVQARRPEPDGLGREISYNGLCVTGGLDRGSWTPDGRWLVALGRLPGDTALSLYALRVRIRGDGEWQTFPTGPVLRLADDPRSGSLPRVRPRLHPYQTAPRIDPQVGRKLSRKLPPSDLRQRPGGPTGQIVYVVQNNNASVVVRSNPDGTGGRVLVATPERNRCPRWSPDGSMVALIGQDGALPGTTPDSLSDPGGEELFVVDADGSNARQLTHTGAMPGDSRTGLVEYGCPVWSPEDNEGGPYIAALVREPGWWMIAVVPVHSDAERGRQVRFATVSRPISGAMPVWSPDGRSIYMADAPAGDGPPRLMRINVPADPSERLTVDVLRFSRRLNGISVLTMEPDGESLIMLQREVNGNPAVARLVRVATNGAGPYLIASPILLEPGRGRVPILSGELDWVTENRIAMALRGSPRERSKAYIYHYDLTYATLQPLASVEDRLGAIAWSPDGRYAVYSTESGLWGLDLIAAREERAAPVWLSPVPVEDLDWR